MEVKNLEDLCNYISEYSHLIYVRAKKKDKWGSYALTELDSKEAINKVLEFIKRGIIPTRLLEESE